MDTQNDYLKYLNDEILEFKVDSKVLTCGEVVWQIQNIAATKLDKIKIPFNEPKPEFDYPEPKFSLNFKTMFFVAFILGVLTASLLDGSGVAGMSISSLTVAVFVYFSVKSLKSLQKTWKIEKKLFFAKLSVWEEMKNASLNIYSLMLETNAGSKPLFYSKNKDQIAKVRDKITLVMNADDANKKIKVEIKTLNMGGEDSINNFGSQIFQQKVGEIKK